MAESGRHRAPSRAHENNHPHRRPELIATAGGAALMVAIGVFSGWAHHSLTAEQPVPATIAATPPANSPAPLMTSPMRVQLRTWLAQAQPSIDAVLAARHDIATAAANNDIDGTGATCESAKDAVVTLQQFLPTPDMRLTNAFQTAISSYRVGLGYCISGAHNHNGNDMARAAGYIRQANGELQAAVDIVEAEVPGAVSHDADVVTV